MVGVGLRGAAAGVGGELCGYEADYGKGQDGNHDTNNGIKDGVLGTFNPLLVSGRDHVLQAAPDQHDNRHCANQEDQDI